MVAGNYARLLRCHACAAEPLLLQHSDDLVVNRGRVAVLVVRSATCITEYYPVIARVRLAMARLALCSQHCLCGPSPLDTLCWLGDGGHKDDRLVDAATRLGARWEGGVRGGHVRIIVVVITLLFTVRSLPLAASASASPSAITTTTTPSSSSAAPRAPPRRVPRGRCAYFGLEATRSPDSAASSSAARGGHGRRRR